MRLASTAVTAALLALALPAATATAAETRPATGARVAAAHAVPGDAVRITEGQVREAAPGTPLLYPSVTSCLTVTVRLAGGGLVGAHASLFQVPGELRSDAILPALRARVGHRPVRSVEVKGALGAWHPGYLTKAIEAYGPDERVPVPSGPDAEGVARAVARALGQPRAVVAVADVPDGDLLVR
ncbi:MULTISPECIES: hypothetical protein [Streptomyces]|uniref:hypothetical protein n=1 Tax=Streptomyces TaxID=1883 RepID=UPI00163CAF54|nr:MULTISPECIES: hypothetical protein [Streptomyces]MBC2878724.1 hypothetical protein [Streptomyces sp. TYQ1024]UBI35167.1 hypothetical protein K7I03_00990 [Streptomyces mobaraensis]UKW27759.1 hypothetical protein MCU78_01030 [Streptomyces sp. TYQ1024]